MHADHLMGLEKPPWTGGKIYCTEVTYRMLIIRFPYLEDYCSTVKMQTWVKVGEYGPKVLELKGVKPDREDLTVSIRFIEANHCPGAAMIHVDGPLGSVLHTGDFRYNGATMLSDIGIDSEKPFNYLFLDNTFATPDEDFPP